MFAEFTEEKLVGVFFAPALTLFRIRGALILNRVKINTVRKSKQRKWNNGIKH